MFKAFAVAVLIAIPAYLLCLAYMVGLLAETGPWWITVTALVSHVLVFAGFASLVDDLRRQVRQLQRE